MIVGVLLLAFVAAASADSCISTVSTVPVSSTVEDVLSSVAYSAPSITSIGSAISTFELDSPSLVTVETVIEYYVPSYETLVDEIESIYNYPSEYTDISAVTAITQCYSSLAYAISELISAESTDSSLAEYQSTLQSLEVYYSSILTYLSAYTYAASPSVASASAIISVATLTSPSIFASVIAVSTAVESSSTVSYAVSYLSYVAYTLPSSVVTEILTIISSPSTVGSSTIASLESCYSTVYSELNYVESFTYSNPSVVTDLVAYLSAASSVSSLGSAVSTIVYYQLSTFGYEVSVLSSASSIVSSVSTDLEVLTALTAESPTLHYAEETIEGSFYSSPSVASAIYYALDYPSLVSSPSGVSVYEESHESFVSAVDYLISFEQYYSSVASTLSSIEYSLTEAFASYRTLLTAFSYVQDVTSPELASASDEISSAKSIVSDVTYVLSDIAYVTALVPSLSCYESVIEYYAVDYPSIASYLLSVDDGVSVVASSSISYVESLIASYPELNSAVVSLVYEFSYYPELLYVESSFIYAAYSDSQLLTEYDSFDYASSYAFQAFDVPTYYFK